MVVDSGVASILGSSALQGERGKSYLFVKTYCTIQKSRNLIKVTLMALNTMNSISKEEGFRQGCLSPRESLKNIFEAESMS